MSEELPGDPIYVHRYVIRSGAALNSASTRREFGGALIRTLDGFGCIHPWPEFGDAAVDEQLEMLARGVVTSLAAIALRCARSDGAARRAGMSLFHGLTIPRSHYSWSFARETEPQLARVLGESWPAIKAKGFANWGETIRFLESIARAGDAANLALRIDFNGCLDEIAFDKFCEYLPLRVYRHLDLIEDPLPYDAALWERFRSRWGVRLAVDKGWRAATHGFDAVVTKPSRRNWRPVASRFPDKPLVLTSAMDHAVGQAFAAYEAALANREIPGRISHCGLATQHLFAADPFFERLTATGGHLSVDREGTGLGFDDLLEKLPWKRLS